MKKQSVILTPHAVSQQALVYTSMVYLNPAQDFCGKPTTSFPLYVRIRGYVYTCGLAQSVPMGKVGMNKKIRQQLQVSLVDKLDVELYQNPADGFMTQLQMEVELGIVPQGDQQFEVDDKLLAETIKKTHLYKYLKPIQCLVVPFNKMLFVCTTDSVKPSSNDQNTRLGPDTKILFRLKTGQKFRLKSQKQQTIALFQSNFKIDEMGIGGLDNQLTNIFRRAFASRRFPQSVIEKFGIKHVKGILLYGPPGTGKTLIARQLAKSLKAKELKIVNGPQIFSRYVGESEQNIRKLFDGAREDQKKYGDQSPLHILVFDQIDAICKQRGTINNGTNAHDLVVNQLLTNIDGVQALNNIIVIGMTNRKDLIDQAILRPGRFEVHIEVGLPNEQGRQQILNIHTKSLKANKLLGDSVSIEKLANICKNFTGAEIEALVKSASSFAMARSTNIMDFSKQLVVKDNVKVQMQDFTKAFEEIKPQFGVDEQKFDIFLRGSLYNYGPRFQRIFATLNNSLKICLNGQMQLSSVLLEGPPGSGKTSIASYFARKCTFPFVKLISPQHFVGQSEMAKINQIVRIFQDAYRSKQACIIIDSLQRLLEFIDLGPRFSNDVLQTLLILLKRLPKKPQCRLLIIGTTSCMSKLSDTMLPQSFNLRLNIPQLNETEIVKVLSQQFNIKESLSQQIGALYKRIPIRRLLQAVDLASNKDIAAWKQYYEDFQASTL